MNYWYIVTFAVCGLIAPFSAVQAQTYDIKNDFCGAYIESAFCKCAFHGEQCDAVGLDQAGAEEYLYDEFDAWTTQEEIKRCDALGKDYEGECVDRRIDPEEKAATLAGNMLCQAADPAFFDNFWDGKEDGVDHEANDNAFAQAHGYDTLDEGVAAYEGMISRASFRTLVENQVTATCPSAGIDFEEFWINAGVDLSVAAEQGAIGEETVDEDEEDQAEDESFFGDSLECNADDHQQFDRKTKQCSCVQLYKMDKEGDCVFTGDEGTKLDVESSVELTALMDDLDPNERDVFIGKNTAGEDVEVGIVRLPSGEYVFTADGVHFYDNPKDAINPGWTRRVRTLVGDVWGDIKQVFGVGRYIAKDTKDDPEKQAEGQRRYDAAVEAFRDLTKNPKPAVTTAETNKIWADRLGKMIEGKSQEFIETEITKKTGVDAKVVGQFVRGEYGDISDAKIQQLTTFLQTLPAQSLVVLAKELRDADFATGASLYMDQREQGSSMEEISNALSEGDLVALDFITAKGVAYEQTRFALLAAYEDAYQRYVLRQELED